MTKQDYVCYLYRAELDYNRYIKAIKRHHNSYIQIDNIIYNL